MKGPVLVTGATGFLGRPLVASLLAEGTPAVALCRRPEDLAELAQPALSTVPGDLRDADACARALAGAATVVHLAALRGHPGAAPAAMREVNELATVRFARQALAAGVSRFVHVSTAVVFGPSPTPLDEEAPLLLAGGGSAYVESKARAIPPLRELARAGAPIVVLYPTLVFGPDTASHPNRVTAHLRRLLRRRIDLTIGGGRARRDLVHRDDVLAAIRAAAGRDAALGRELLVTGEPISQRELGELAARAAGRRPPLVVSAPMFLGRAMAGLVDRALGYDRRAGYARALATLGESWTFRGERARRALDLRPRPLVETIAETVAWIRAGAR